MATASCVGAPDLESGGHSELSCPIGFVAQIPWLPQTGDSVPFTESHFYKNHVCRSDSLDPNAAKTEEINRLALHRILTETFPFYLPARYHTMDAAQMQKCAASPGSYWSNAIHFVRTCSDFGTIPFSNIDTEMNAPRPWIENCFIKNSECKFKDFAKGGPEQCTTAAEFLLEPWVLMQLPFQPALLHQWTVALMAESQKFTKRIQEIRTRGCAPEFYYLLLQLTGLSEKLSDNSIAFCQVFFHHYCCHPTYSLILRINWSYKYHWRLLAETLAALSYALSDECSHVLDCIKRESWGRKLAPSNLKMLSKYKDSDLFDDFTRVYSEKYWLSPQVTNLYKKAESTDSIVSPKAEKLGLAQSVSQEDLKIVQNFVKEVILNGGPLKGLTDPAAFIDKIDTLLGSEKFYLLKSHVIKYQSLADRDSSSPRVEKGGVLLDILRLEADVQREISRGSATKLIWLAAEDFEKDVFLDSNGSASLEDKALDVKDTVEKLLISWTKREETWSRKRLLKRAEATIIKSATSINVSDFQFDSEAVQIFLTMRIRETLLQIYKKMYKTLDSGNFLFYPEAHIIQYILPCFVAMIRDVDNDPQLAKKTKKNYRRLVDEITQSYSVSNALPQDLDSNYRREYFHGRRDYDEYRRSRTEMTSEAFSRVEF